jgi:UDP-N-acetylglucosamine--N-acetylmuramyl-(pentapeptide) pyrophosphoryl-undecaprenol N-acetylglucosamine transferase
LNIPIQKTVMLAAGGTGGHLFPAQALAEVLIARGIAVHLMTDDRARDYGKNFPAQQTHIVPSASLSLSNPMAVPAKAFRLARGYLIARKIMKQIQPAAIVGFGGYPSLPPLMAATHLGVASLVHEQNAVLGRANAVMARRVDAIATSFETVVGIETKSAGKVTFTGNPVRSIALNYAGTAFPAFGPNDKLKLVVFGGSQGARFFSEVMPKAVGLLSPQLRARLNIVQQCREEDLATVRGAYAELKIEAKLAPFFSDMPREISESHLVLCRSGASSIAELGVIGRPAVLVPLPHAIDNDQQRNAESFAAVGAGFIHAQKTLDPHALADILEKLLNAPQALKEAAEAAKQHGKPDAAQRLADLVERTMRLTNQAHRS